MTTITSSRALPHKDTPAPQVISTTADIAELLQRSNHATAFAGWTVTTIAMGLVLQADTLRSIPSFTVTLMLVALLVPILAATARTAILLTRAGWAVSGVGGDGEPTGAAADITSQTPQPLTARQAHDRLRSVIASVQLRNARTRRAVRWACGSGAAFLLWSLTVILTASG
jgi:hypothetical protein